MTFKSARVSEVLSLLWNYFIELVKDTGGRVQRDSQNLVLDTLNTSCLKMLEEIKINSRAYEFRCPEEKSVAEILLKSSQNMNRYISVSVNL